MFTLIVGNISQYDDLKHNLDLVFSFFVYRVYIILCLSYLNDSEDAIIRYDTVDGNQKSGINSPVEGKVVDPSHYLLGFQHHPNGGWPWDF